MLNKFHDHNVLLNIRSLYKTPGYPISQSCSRLSKSRKLYQIQTFTYQIMSLRELQTFVAYRYTSHTFTSASSSTSTNNDINDVEMGGLCFQNLISQDQHFSTNLHAVSIETPSPPSEVSTGKTDNCNDNFCKVVYQLGCFFLFAMYILIKLALCQDEREIDSRLLIILANSQRVLTVRHDFPKKQGITAHKEAKKYTNQAAAKQLNNQLSLVGLIFPPGRSLKTPPLSATDNQQPTTITPSAATKHNIATNINAVKRNKTLFVYTYLKQQSVITTISRIDFSLICLYMTFDNVSYQKYVYQVTLFKRNLSGCLVLAINFVVDC
ncbi:hypothetical protein GQX74_005720 [Glossina fuscipes]|nr:hypothetical protein GQX74_005720 [Glossina fuscipes]